MTEHKTDPEDLNGYRAEYLLASHFGKGKNKRLLIVNTIQYDLDNIKGHCLSSNFVVKSHDNIEYSGLNFFTAIDTYNSL